MKDKILFTIYTCNRFYYLKNCVESIIKYVDMDRIKILVCDMNTVEPGFDEYINNMSNKHNIEIHKFSDRSRNELYRGMNWSIKYAKKEGYPIINLIQDDYQYLYKRNSHIDEVWDIFSTHERLAQINYNLMWRRKIDRIGKLKNFSSLGTNYATVVDKNPCDNGFTRVSVYEKTGFYPEKAISWGHGKDRYVGKMNGELWFGKKCSKLKYKRAVCYLPNVGMVFDCAYVRGNERYGDYFPPEGEFYFKKLDDKQVEKICRNHKKHRFSFIEDYCVPDGWKPKTMGKHSESKKVVRF